MQVFCMVPGLLAISIHTTARVVTTWGAKKYATKFISIHTTARVVTPGCKQVQLSAVYFNPHHRTGGDMQRGGWGSDGVLFQSTPPHGW